MVTKELSQSKIKVDSLDVNKETLQDLTEADAGKVKGGLGDRSDLGTCPKKTEVKCPPKGTAGSKLCVFEE